VTGPERGPEREDAWGSELASEAEFAADLSAVQADDALLDMLGGSDPAIADGLGDQELNALLVAWRRDIDSEPLAELVDIDTAVRTVTGAAQRRRHESQHRRRVLVPVAVAAAVLAIAFTGTGLAARSAEPGDTLWGLTKVLYADHARSVEAAATAKLDLEKANLAIAGGNLAAARKALNDAQAALAQVADEDDKNQLMEQHRQLAAQLDKPLPPGPGATTTSTTQAPASSNPSASGSATSLPGSGSTSLPGTSTVSTPPPLPPTSVTPTTPTTTQPTGATGNDPGTNSARNESSGGGQPAVVSPSP
jgi:hypothetical protein